MECIVYDTDNHFEQLCIILYLLVEIKTSEDDDSNTKKKTDE